jgi:predicted dehydrogenase
LSFVNIVAAIWSKTRGETSNAPSFADGLRGVALVEAAVKSAKERRAVEVL